MADELDDDADGSKREQDVAAAEAFGALVKKAGGSTAAAKLLNRSRGAVEKWASGKSRLPLLDVLKLAYLMDRSLERFEGFVPMDGPVAAGPVLQSSIGLPPEDDTGAPVVEGPAPAGYVELPLLDVTASAGSGSYALGGTNGSIAARESWLRTIGAHPTKTEALTARGDSMEPTIRDGDLLLVDRSIDRIMDDAVYVVTVFGAVKVKRVTRRTDGSVVLSSDNPRHPPETVPRAEVNDVLTIEGRVRWCGRLM